MSFDFYHLEDNLTDKQKELVSNLRAFINQEILPKINHY